MLDSDSKQDDWQALKGKYIALLWNLLKKGYCISYNCSYRSKYITQLIRSLLKYIESFHVYTRLLLVLFLNWCFVTRIVLYKKALLQEKKTCSYVEEQQKLWRFLLPQLEIRLHNSGFQYMLFFPFSTIPPMFKSDNSFFFFFFSYVASLFPFLFSISFHKIF